MIFGKQKNKNDIIKTEDILDTVRIYCKNDDTSEKNIKATSTALGLGVCDRYKTGCGHCLS
jgi:hypothetical protein